MTNVQKAFAKVVSESGLNLVQIAQLSGIKQQTLSAVKTGRRQISLKVIIKMCDALEISYDELIKALVIDIKSAGTL